MAHELQPIDTLAVLVGAEFFAEYTSRKCSYTTDKKIKLMMLMSNTY